jgi:two-component system chemotaxis response regulator CheB
MPVSDGTQPDRSLEASVQTRDTVVVGGSAGALSALVELLRGLPASLPAAIFVVVHSAPNSSGALPMILSNATSFPARTAIDGEPIRLGQVYVAPPDHHLLVYPRCVRVTRGPRENRFRPAIDPLFRTAAAAYGPRVIGVILSGGQGDGVIGLSQIKRKGGVVIAQDPRFADSPGMPENAIRQVGVHHVLRPDDMAAVISGLVGAPVEEGTMTADTPHRDRAETGTDALDSGILPGPPSSFTCPECGGALWELREDQLVSYQCHVGHSYNGDDLVVAQSETLESALWTALRTLEEGSALRRRMAQHARQHGMLAIAEGYEDQAAETEARARVIRQAITEAPASRRAVPASVED